MSMRLSGCVNASAGPERRKKRKTGRADRSSQEGRKDNLGSRSPETDWLRKVEMKKLTISGGNDEGVPPVPIPNTEVKPFSADGT